MIPITKYEGQLPDNLANRSQLDIVDVSDTVRDIIGKVRLKGDAALIEYTRQFDGVKLTSEALRVTDGEIALAYRAVDMELLRSLRRCRDNIRAFHAKQARQTWINFERGAALGQMTLPLASVGIYVPGGTAAYPSSVLMNALPAKVAGVERIVMVTPPGGAQGILPLTLVAAAEAGVDEIYRVGGAQAVAALAFGTESIAGVDKIVGPGNIYVANAKRQVFGHVGIDMIAGPSEIMIVADDSANAAYVAADLLSQAEHDPLAAAVLATTSERLAREVASCLETQLPALPRRSIAGQSIASHGAILLCDDLGRAMEAANRFAPEHLELCVADPFALLGLVKNAGAVFLGHYSPEPLGDYFAGPNHVLPTSGTARFSSPLSVDDFVKKTSVVYYDSATLKAAADDITRFARAEGLEAHANAVAIRCRDDSPERKEETKDA